MYRISVHDFFSSAHQLKGYRGKCEAVHGHNWKVDIEVQGETLNDIGLLMDFTDLKKILKSAIDPLDHVLLNEVEGFRDKNPSSELIARHVYNRVKDILPEDIEIAMVTVWESVSAKAIYFE